MSAISLKRPPSFDRAQDGPEQRRRATARTGQHVDPERSAHEVRPAPCVLAGRLRLAPAGWIGRGLGGSGLAAVDVLSGRGCVDGGDLPEIGALCSLGRVGSAGLAAVGGVPETHDERPPRRPWSQYAMVQNEVDAGPRDQDGQPLQQFEGIEQEVRGPIRPRVPELEHHLPLGRQTKPVLRDGRPQRVPAEPLESVPLLGRDAHASLEVEALLARVTAPGSGHRALATLVLDLD